MPKSWFIVESHHHVMSAWAGLRQELPQPPRLITLDHHTDTSAPFRNYFSKNALISAVEQKRLRIQWNQDLASRSKAAFNESMMRLNNDEHVVAAIEAGIISSAFVVAHRARDTDWEIYNAHKIMCRGVGRGAGLPTRKECDEVLEDNFLKECLIYFDQLLTSLGEVSLLDAPYILDIDLDYFNTWSSVSPQNSSVFRTIAENAKLITVAKETSYVEHCALDKDLSSDGILKKLEDLLP